MIPVRPGEMNGRTERKTKNLDCVLGLAWVEFGGHIGEKERASFREWVVGC